MVEDKLVLLVKQLQTSFTELETVSTISVAINGTDTVVFLKHRSFKSLQDTITAANSLETRMCSKCILLT